jgi:hypothetical protein
MTAIPANLGRPIRPVYRYEYLSMAVIRETR